MPEYLVSLIIPTKNRPQYCIEVVKQVFRCTNELVEIVIQDNSDNNELQNRLQEFSTDRIVYHYENRMLSFVDNFSQAVHLAHGEYCCMIGDDDGVLPNMIDAAIYAKRHQLDALVPAVNSVYIWPCKKPIIKGGENGYLALTYIRGEIIQIDPMQELRKVISQGFQNYQATNIPRLYHGLVHKNVLEKINMHVGAYFKGLTPDMYMAIALALTTKKVCALKFPITISGICPASGSAASATGAHTGKLEDAPHFKGHDQYQWSTYVPAVYSVESIWADTAIHALEDFGQKKMIDSKCLVALYARLWSAYSQFHEEIIECAVRNHISIPKIRVIAWKIKIAYSIKRLLRRITRKPGDVIKHYNVANIERAEHLTTRRLKDRRILIG